MTRSLSTGYVKKQESIPSWKKFILMLETVNLDGTMGHLFVVDIRFNFNESNAKILMYNEICCPTFEKQKTIDATERSIFQLNKTLRNDDPNSDPKSYLCTKNTQQC